MKLSTYLKKMTVLLGNRKVGKVKKKNILLRVGWRFFLKSNRLNDVDERPQGFRRSL